MKQDFALLKIATDSLPAPLPAGERIIWQGKPSVKSLALRAFHIRGVALYFGLVSAWRLSSDLSSGMSFGDAAIAASWLVVPALAAVIVLCALAWAFARAALYTVTSQRVLLQFGVALPMTLNIPLDKISGAALKTYKDGSGDIPLTLSDNKASFLLLWPHVRPWQLSAAQPMLRSVPEAAHVASKISEALSGQPMPSVLAVTPIASADRLYAPAGTAVAA